MSNMKAAEDGRSPKPCGKSNMPKSALAFWSAAVLCRFSAYRELMQLGKSSFGRQLMKRKYTTRLDEQDHRLLVLWAADCAEHVLAFFEDTDY